MKVEKSECGVAKTSSSTSEKDSPQYIYIYFL